MLLPQSPWTKPVSQSQYPWYLLQSYVRSPCCGSKANDEVEARGEDAQADPRRPFPQRSLSLCCWRSWCRWSSRSASGCSSGRRRPHGPADLTLGPGRHPPRLRYLRPLLAGVLLQLGAIWMRDNGWAILPFTGGGTILLVVGLARARRQGAPGQPRRPALLGVGLCWSWARRFSCALAAAAMALTISSSAHRPAVLVRARGGDPLAQPPAAPRAAGATLLLADQHRRLEPLPAGGDDRAAARRLRHVGARARGLSERRIVWAHALRACRAALIVTRVALDLGAMFAGVVVDGDGPRGPAWGGCRATPPWRARHRNVAMGIVMIGAVAVVLFNPVAHLGLRGPRPARQPGREAPVRRARAFLGPHGPARQGGRPGDPRGHRPRGDRRVWGSPRRRARAGPAPRAKKRLAWSETARNCGVGEDRRITQSRRRAGGSRSGFATALAATVVGVGPRPAGGAGAERSWVDTALGRLTDLFPHPDPAFAVLIVLSLTFESIGARRGDPHPRAAPVAPAPPPDPGVGAVTRESAYVEAARAAGAGGGRVLCATCCRRRRRRPGRPRGSTSWASRSWPRAHPSFLSLGIDPDGDPSWGHAPDRGAGHGRGPPVAHRLSRASRSVLTVLAAALLGDAVRAALDPRSGRARPRVLEELAPAPSEAPLEALGPAAGLVGGYGPRRRPRPAAAGSWRSARPRCAS